MDFLIGNTNSPVRSLAMKNGEMIAVERGSGSQIFLKDGTALLDFVLGYGCLPFGHAYPPLIEYLQKKLECGSAFGLTSTAEMEVAEAVICALDLNKDFAMRMLCSGSDATALAIRLSKHHTGRRKIITFTECYHGWGEAFFDTETVLSARFNDLDSVQYHIEKNPDAIAAIILEPFCANNGLILPEGEFLKKLEDLCKEKGIMLLFDEVITAFRLHFGGAFRFYGVQPDIIILGKVLSQGYPFGAVVGKREIMKHLSPSGNLFHAGTFNGNLLACHAALFTLDHLHKHFSELSETAAYLQKKIQGVHQAGTVFSLPTKDNSEYTRLYNRLLENNIFISPSRSEVSFLSLTHGKREIDALSEVMKEFKETPLDL